VIADETYERLVWSGRRHVSIATLLGMRGRTVSLYGMTKAFAMGGWRIGFALAPEPVADAMVTLQQHLNTCVGSFAQTGATVALDAGPHPEVVALRRDWEARCGHAADVLSRVAGVACARPEGGFYAWIALRETRLSSQRVAELLLERHHVALVPGSSFGPEGEGYLRMTCVRSWDELREGLARLEQALPELSHE
jgi:aspartate/methionine/tyrosine aminotransferase